MCPATRKSGRLFRLFSSTVFLAAPSQLCRNCSWLFLPSVFTSTLLAFWSPLLESTGVLASAGSSPNELSTFVRWYLVLTSSESSSQSTSTICWVIFQKANTTFKALKLWAAVQCSHCFQALKTIIVQALLKVNWPPDYVEYNFKSYLDFWLGFCVILSRSVFFTCILTCKYFLGFRATLWRCFHIIFVQFLTVFNLLFSDFFFYLAGHALA